MPTTLVIGASGQIGRFLIPRLLQAGQNVIALSRQFRESNKTQLRWICGDLNTTIPALPPLDVIYSLGPLDAFSSWFSANDQIRCSRVIAFGSMSAISKRESPDLTERALAHRLVTSEHRVIDTAEARDIAWTVFRPTMIYGAGIDRSLTPLAHLGLRYRVFPVMHSARGLRQPVHAEDLAEACLLARDCDASNRIYSLGGGERLSFGTVLQRVRASLDVRTFGIPAGGYAARIAMEVARIHPRWRGLHSAALGRLQRDLIADDAPARGDFGWSPRDFSPDVTTWVPKEIR